MSQWRRSWYERASSTGKSISFSTLLGRFRRTMWPWRCCRERFLLYIAIPCPRHIIAVGGCLSFFLFLSLPSPPSLSLSLRGEKQQFYLLRLVFSMGTCACRTTGTCRQSAAATARKPEEERADAGVGWSRCSSIVNTCPPPRNIQR